MKANLKRYFFYLAPELHKFADMGWAEEFFNKYNNTKDYIDFRFPKDFNELSQQFSTREGILNYLQNLPEEYIFSLAQFLSIKWRNDGVFEKLRITNFWKDEIGAIDKIFVNPAEPHLKQFFSENKYFLPRILEDKRIMDVPPYCNYRKGNSVAFENLLAIQKNSSEYKIFDGIHRAVQLIINGNRELKLHYAIHSNQ